jgi:hypothetical protein
MAAQRVATIQASLSPRGDMGVDITDYVRRCKGYRNFLVGGGLGGEGGRKTGRKKKIWGETGRREEAGMDGKGEERRGEGVA